MAQKKVKRNKKNDLITVDRARQYANNKSEYMYQGAMSLCFRTLLDKYGWTYEDIMQLSNEIANLADSIKEGRITVKDVIYSLKDEEGLLLKTVYPDKL